MFIHFKYTTRIINNTRSIAMLITITATIMISIIIANTITNIDIVKNHLHRHHDDQYDRALNIIMTIPARKAIAAAIINICVITIITVARLLPPSDLHTQYHMWTGVRWPVAVAATATDILNCGDGDQGSPFSLVVRPSAYKHRTHSIWHPAKQAGQCYNLKNARTWHINC